MRSATGNILRKSDVGDYSYNSPRPHAVTDIYEDAGRTMLRATFTYDPNGNETTAWDTQGQLNRTTTWRSYNKPATITSGTRTLTFLDDFDHQRFKQVTPENTRLYLSAFGVQAELVLGSGVSLGRRSVHQTPFTPARPRCDSSRQ